MFMMTECKLHLPGTCGRRNFREIRRGLLLFSLLYTPPGGLQYIHKKCY